MEERRAWILSILAFGDSAAATFTKLAGEAGLQEARRCLGVEHLHVHHRVGVVPVAVAGGDHHQAGAALGDQAFQHAGIGGVVEDDQPAPLGVLQPLPHRRSRGGRVGARSQAQADAESGQAGAGQGGRLDRGVVGGRPAAHPPRHLQAAPIAVGDLGRQLALAHPAHAGQGLGQRHRAASPSRRVASSANNSSRAQKRLPLSARGTEKTGNSGSGRGAPTWVERSTTTSRPAKPP